eukprot:10652080-Ditylum_brightwellii.AAC.1
MMDDKEWQNFQLSPFPSEWQSIQHPLFCNTYDIFYNAQRHIMRVCNNFLWWSSGTQRLLSCLVHADNATLKEEPMMHALTCSTVYGDSVETPPSPLPPCDFPSE